MASAMLIDSSDERHFSLCVISTALFVSANCRLRWQLRLRSNTARSAKDFRHSVTSGHATALYWQQTRQTYAQTF